MVETDVLVMGAGPAGLAAAVSARRAGATVRMLDSSDQSGGQYWRHLPADRPAGRGISGCTTNGSATNSFGRPSTPIPL